MTAAKQVQTEKFFFSSSIKDDVWHRQSGTEAYEWWYFDALSDDGKDAIVAIFLDNFIFSPRYNQSVQSSKVKVETSETENQKPENEESETQYQKSEIARFPALVFVYYRNGKPIYRAINEFSPEDFTADTELPACKLGNSSFKFESTPYGSGYLLTIKANLRRKQKLEAHLEWLSIESDFLPHKNFGAFSDKHSWNLVAPRSDVTGSLKVTDENGKFLEVRQFRGTGYHDHNADARWLPETVKDWQWGRAHFSDATAVYYRYRPLDSDEELTKLFIVKNNELKVFDAQYEERKMRRSIFGIKFPKEITLSTDDGIRLNITQFKPLDESFFYLRFLSDARLKCPDSETRQSLAITEHLAPKALKNRRLDWLVNMRIGKSDKGAFLA